MERSCSRSHLASLVVWLLIAAPMRSDASGMLSGYTVSDLGTQATLPNPGYGYIVSGDGKTGYSFSQTYNPISQDRWNSIQLPVGPAAAGVQGSVGNSLMNLGSMNSSGTFVGRELSGLQGGAGAQLATIFTTQLQSDGLFGPPTVLWSSPFNGQYIQYHGVNSTGPVPSVLGVDAQGQLFGTMVVPGVGTSGPQSEYVLYDLKTGTYSVLPDHFGPWAIDYVSIIDDQGRLLVQANPGDGGQDHVLLLTPDAIYTGPVSTPEPSTLAILGIGAAGAWWHRRRARRAA